MPTREQVWKEVKGAASHLYFLHARGSTTCPKVLNEGEHVLALTSGAFMQNAHLARRLHQSPYSLRDCGMFFGVRQVRQINLDRFADHRVR